MALTKIFSGMEKGPEAIDSNFANLNMNKEPVHTLSVGENLWSGGLVMGANHTITPKKTISQCEHGWALVWADFRDTKRGAYSKVTYISKVVNGGQTVNQGMANLTISADGYDQTVHKLIVWSNTQINGHAMNTSGDIQLYILTDIVSY